MMRLEEDFASGKVWNDTEEVRSQALYQPSSERGSEEKPG